MDARLDVTPTLVARGDALTPHIDDDPEQRLDGIVGP
jgi:hypothetical protein